MVLGPVDHLRFIVSESLPVEGAGTGTTFFQLCEASLADQVPARKEDLHIVSIVCATTTIHLRFPYLVLHACDLNVHTTYRRRVSDGHLLPNLELLLDDV